LAAIRARDNVLQNYLFHFLDNNQTLFTGHIGMSFDSISTSEELPEIKIPLPPLEMQQRIVNECEGVDLETDQARQTVTSAKHQIEAKVQSVINAGYEMKNIDRVLTLEYGISLPKNQRMGGDFPVYGSNGVVGTHNEFLVNAPCIIVGRKGSAGEINWSDKSCTPIDTTFYVKLLDETATDLKFTYHMLKSLNLPSLKVGSGPGGINRNNVYGLQIPMPPLNVQQQLVVEVKQLESEITQAQAVIDNATERKNAILTNYLMKIDSQNR
jgi:restriction endonuclease S subunit